MLSLFHRRGSQFRLWSFQLPRLSSPPHAPRTPSRPYGLHSLHVPSSLPGLSSRVPPDACRWARCYRVPAPQPYRSQGAGMRGGCAKPVPRSPPRAPTLEAAAPLRSRAAGAGCAETTGGQRAETRLPPGGRLAGRGGRRGRGPSRPRAPEPSSPPPRPARGVKRSGARGGRSFPRTGLPGKHWRSLFLER